MMTFNSTSVQSQCWQSIGVGSTHSLGIKIDGSLYAWGNNADGELGDSTTIETKKIINQDRLLII